MSVVDEVKSRINIVDVVGRYTQLRRAGTTYKGLCPFHTERTPSFTVNEERGMWYCFGSCGTGGDVFSFLMKKEGMTFREALEQLAREAGVSLEDEGRDSGRSQREALYQVNQAAAKYFRTVLQSDSRAAVGRAYLQRRRIDEPTAEAFGLGFALDEWSALRDHLLRAGFSVELQLAAGLLKQSQERESTYDAFRNRLIFPIRDQQGRVFGFGGRVLDDSTPKYLNTAETPLFRKSEIIYGIDLAKAAIRSEDRVVIVEGYMDVIAAHQHGFANVVACMGTALTAEHLRQLQKLTKNFVLALDADAAGEAATIRALNQARMSLERKSTPTVLPGGSMKMTDRLGASLAIMQMPAGKDPDDVVRDDPALWRSLVAGALPLVDYYFDVVSRIFDVKTAAGKAAAAAELIALIAELRDDVEQEHYIRQLSRMVQKDEAYLHGQVKLAARALVQRPAEEKRKTQVATGNRVRDDRLPPEPPPDVGEWMASDGWDAGGYAGAEAGGWLDTADAAAPQRAPRQAGGLDLPLRSTIALLTDVEQHILVLLLREQELLPWLTQRTAELDLPPPSPAYMARTEDKELLLALQLYLTSDEPWDYESFQEYLDPVLHGRLGDLANVGAHLPARSDLELREGLIKDIVHLRLQQLKSNCDAVKWLIDEAAQANDRDQIRELSSRLAGHQRELAHVQPLRMRERLLAATLQRAESRLRL